MRDAKFRVKAAHYDVWIRFCVALTVFCLSWATAVIASWLIRPEYWWAFILYGIGVGLIIGLKIKIKYSLSSVCGAVLAIVAATAIFWTARIAWFYALLFSGLTVILVGFSKFQCLKMLEARILNSKKSR